MIWGFANGGVQPGGPLPGNVQAVGYVPLSVLLPTCAAVVHHGGSGTTATALAVGPPQVALPHTADQVDVSAAIERRGVGLVEFPDQTTAERLYAAIRRVLDHEDLRGHAAEVAAENAALPSPAQVISTLVAAVGDRSGITL